MHTPPSGPENPAGHWTEHSADELPGIEVFPNGHDKHTLSPASGLCLPDSQIAQVPPLAPEKPAGHWTEHSADELPGIEVFPNGHDKHTLSPASGLCLPDSQIAQVPPLAPEKPGLQVQVVETELPNTESEFVGHLKHVDD